MSTIPMSASRLTENVGQENLRWGKSVPLCVCDDDDDDDDVPGSGAVRDEGD